MFDFLSYGFGSVLGGLLTSLLIAGSLVAYSTQFTRRGSVEPLPLAICGVLFCLLFYQLTLMYGAFGNKEITLDFISACNLQFGDEINGSELKSQVISMIRENPLILFFIDYADLESVDWSQPIKSLHSVVAREYNWYIFRRIVWSLVFTGIAFAFITLSFKNKRGFKKRKYSFSDDDDILNFD